VPGPGEPGIPLQFPRKLSFQSPPLIFYFFDQFFELLNSLRNNRTFYDTVLRISAQLLNGEELEPD
jgi:hypothetical protein